MANDARIWFRRSGYVAQGSYGPGSSWYAFIWDPDLTAGVTNYILELGSAQGLADRYVIDTSGVGTVYQAQVLTGTYWMRVKAYIGAVLNSTTPDAQLVVT